MRSHRGGGMPGAVDVDLGPDDSALDTEFSIGGTELPLLKQMGKAHGWMASNCALSALSSVTMATGACRPWSWSCADVTKEVEISGVRKTGESNTTKATSTNSHAKPTINGEVLGEVDLINMVEICGRCGPDGSAPQRPWPLDVASEPARDLPEPNLQ
ncbi:phage major tail tube protein [Escherichia coli]|nr:phage major tail tube protein [Escherichia coli]